MCDIKNTLNKSFLNIFFKLSNYVILKEIFKLYTYLNVVVQTAYSYI